MITLVSWPKRIDMGVSQTTVKQFEDAILDDLEVNRSTAIESTRNIVNGYLLGLLNRTYRNATLRHISMYLKSAISSIEIGSDHRFGIMMGREFRKLLPCLQGSGRRSVYCFDVWPKFQDRLADFINFADIQDIFVSSSQAAASLRGRLPGRNICWVPEGISPMAYRWLPPEEKDIDVICIGRRYDSWHAAVSPTIVSRGIRFRHEKVYGGLIHLEESEFNLALARSKISICVPRSITNPNQAMGIETMTFRYLQSMSSKCLVLGHAPKEMIELFGYNPVVEIDMSMPGDQLTEILRNMDRYQGLVERNYRATLLNHSWWHRWKQIRSCL